jgi:hypothetical protein
MRKDFVETREIADSDLDNVSGGVGVNLDPAVNAAQSALPVDQVTGLVGQTTGLDVAGIAGQAQGVTGLAGL